MKKIILAFDGVQFSEGAFNFARQLNDLHSILLTGVFVPQMTYANLWSYADGVPGVAYIPLLEEGASEIVQENIQRFTALCQQNDIEYKVHKDFYDFALPQLKKETRFADLLILSSETFYKNLRGSEPTEYLQNALHNAECPVVIVPENFSFPKITILAYDGTDSSVYAIKQFAYLFPELCHQETLLVYSSFKEDDTVPEEKQMEELARQHFSNLSFLKLELNRKKFCEWVNKNSNAILVSGSFGRSSFSQMLRKSFIQDVIAEHKLPVFIAHK